MAKERDYVLVTPAKNEQANIERLIRAVLSQTVLPKKWVIVDDGSTDSTAQIVASYAVRKGFIELVTAPKRTERDFASKARGFKVGFARFANVDYDLVGNLDADISLPPDYFERILQKFSADPRLGIAGGIIWEKVGEQFLPQHLSPNSVAGAVQLFRAQCYADIGGYIPLRHGGIDAAAEIMARMRGWSVETFPELPVHHHRRVSTGRKWILSTRFFQGRTNYLLGYHPVFQVLSSVSRMVDRPYILGSLTTLLGYLWFAAKSTERGMPADAVRFLRTEQKARLGQAFGIWKPARQ